MPIAYEGALKLKEISYIHAEAYPAGEMKHGPIALVDKEMPVIAIAPMDPWHEKMISQVEQVKARGGVVVVVATEGDTLVQGLADHVFWVPDPLATEPGGNGHPPAVICLPYCLPAGPGCRSAAQSGKIGYRGIKIEKPSSYWPYLDRSIKLNPLFLFRALLFMAVFDQYCLNLVE